MAETCNESLVCRTNKILKPYKHIFKNQLISTFLHLVKVQPQDSVFYTGILQDIPTELSTELENHILFCF